jgi:hypothetical protein
VDDFLVEELEEGGRLREALAAGLGLSLTIILAAPWRLLFSLVLGFFAKQNFSTVHLRFQRLATILPTVTAISPPPF